MKQALLYKFNPQQMLDLLEGRLSIGVFKRDLPQWAKDKIERGEVVQGYGYCMKGKPYLEPRECNGEFVWNIHNDFIYHTDLNGRVVVKFEVSGRRYHNLHYFNLLPRDHFELDKACITKDELLKYMKVKKGDDISNLYYYAHHFTNIQPVHMELGEFVSDKLVVNVCGKEFKCYSETASYFARKDQHLTKAPQSFQTVWVKGE